VTTPAFSHLFAHVGDYERTRHLLVDLLGLEVLMEEGGYLRVGGGDGFHVGIEAAPAGTKPETEIVVRVADVDATLERLRAAGIEISDPIDAPWGVRYASFRDADGRPMSLAGPLREDRP
jgi:catechol 2,3-dioxygenase-like lactoylglutathione lyase family enzyme